MKPYHLAEEWLVRHAEEVVKHLFPEAKLKGNDYVVGDLDGHPGDSLHITVKGSKTGLWKDFANGEKGSKRLATLWKAARKISDTDHATFFTELTNFSGQSFSYTPPGNGAIDWPQCLANWTHDYTSKLIKLRGDVYTRDFVDYLHDEIRQVGAQYGRIVFPVIGPGGVMVGLHRYHEKEGILKFSRGCKVHPLVFGDMGPITELHVHEGRWDAYALASATGWYRTPGIRFLSTLGAGNGKLIKDQVPPGAKVYCWEQHDKPAQNGLPSPNERWFKSVAANAGTDIYRVQFATQYKDLNDWLRDGGVVTEMELDGARSAALIYAGPLEAGQAAGAQGVTTPSSPSSTLFPPPESRPCYRLYDRDFEDQGRSWKAGIYLHTLDKQDQPIDEWILSVLRVVAITRTRSGRGHGYLLEYVPHGESVVRYEVVPQSLLVGHINDLLKFLRDLGVSALYEYKELIRSYLDREHRKFSASHPQDFWESVSVVGWHDPGRTFVLPHKVIGAKTGVWFASSGEGAQYDSRGTLEDWNLQVAKWAQGNPYLTFGISCGFSGPLLGLLNVLGVGFHLLGDSTSGKTTVLLVSTSTWGPPKFMLSWRQTANRLESQAASRSDTLLAIDESHMIDPKALDACIYMLVGGVAKGRLKRDSTAAETASWHIPILSCGECALETRLSAERIDPKAGQGVRICDIPVKGKYGVFDYLPGVSDHLPADLSPAAFADMLRENAAASYGTAGPAFVEKLISEYPHLDLHEELTKILSSQDVSSLSAQQQRVWRSFALVGLAGELAIRWKIVQWEAGSAASAACDLFEAWRRAQPESATSKEHAQILRLVRDAISMHGTSQFSAIDGGTRKLFTDTGAEVEESVPRIINRMGYWKDENKKRIFGFTSEGLRRATKGYDFDRVIRALQEAKAFVKTGPKQVSVTTWIPGENRAEHLYWIDPEKLNS